MQEGKKSSIIGKTVYHHLLQRLKQSAKTDKSVDDDVDVALPEDVDLEKLKTDDDFASSFSGGIGSMDNGTVEKISNALGRKKFLTLKSHASNSCGNGVAIIGT
jgi:hypothetical protein